MNHSGGNSGDGDAQLSGASRQAGSTTKPEVSPEAIRALPADFAKRHRILPIGIDATTIRILSASPGRQEVIDDIRLITGLEVEESEAPASEILEKIAHCYQVTVERMIEKLGPESTANGEGKNLHDIEVMANEPTVVNLVNVIVS